MKWTPEQLSAIQTTGTSLLVSAAAGSGKTAVLAERCAYLVCEANPSCSIDELLVVTFTNATADEMRSRIESALRKRMTDSDDPRLARQLLLISRASINTLHGFCSSFLRRHFHLLGIDPNFRVLDQQEVDLLKHEIAREVLDERYDAENNAEFQRFVDHYGNGDDRIILRSIRHLHELTGSMVNPAQWLVDAQTRIAAAQSGPLGRTEMGKELAKLIRRGLDDLHRRWVQLAERIAEITGLEPYGEYVNDLLAATQLWRDAFGDGNFDKLAKQIVTFEPEKLPTIRRPPREKEAIQEQIGALRKEMREGTIASVSRFTEQQWRDGLAVTSGPVSLLIELVKDFGDRFAKAKRELRAIDFSDLERFTLQILREDQAGSELRPSSVARFYHQQFKHVLVDEYQDINEVQDAILHLLSRESDEKADGKNLFCVGDVKQSIYRFRLAQPGRFLKRYDLFKGLTPSPGTPGEGRGEGSVALDRKNPHPNPLPEYRARGSNGKVIDLGANFRSRGPLLEVINGVFKRLMSREAVEIEYDKSQYLVPQAKYPPAGNTPYFTGAPVELHLLPAPARTGGEDDSTDSNVSELDRTEREAAFVAHRIRELIDSGVNVAAKGADGALGMRSIQYRDIVILLRSVKSRSEQFAQALRANGVPVHSDSASGFFESSEIRDMLALLRVLDNRQQDIPLAAVLRSPLSGLADPDDGLARIRIAFPSGPFHQAVVRYAAECHDELAAHLRSFLVDLNDWRQMARQCPVAETTWHIFERSGYLAFCAGMEDGPQRVANLIEFHQRARQFGTFQRQGLGRFLEFLDNLAEHSDLSLPSITSQADDVVRVMSIHRSKGLEFPVVILPDLGKQHNLQDAQGQVLVDRQAGIGLMVADEKRRVRYPSLAHVLVQERIRKETLAEEMRVLYVAMTRAREHLILVGAGKEEDGQKWRDQWAKHAGRLPAERVLAGRTMLDWLGPVAAAMEGAGEKHCIEITWHSEDEIAQWAITGERGEKLSDAQLKLARLEPLNPPPVVSREVHALTTRLTTPYRHESFTELPAVQSVGALTKQGQPIPSASNGLRKELPIPRWALAEFKLSPTETGTATHLVLEHLNFSRRCDPEDLRLQIADFVRRKQMTEEMGQVVDVESIHWLAGTPLGQLLRKNNSHLRRELPVFYPLTSARVPSSSDPMDRVMVRGKIDVLIPDVAGFVVADYKTDRVNERTMDAQVENYRSQLSSYRDAIGAIAKKPVKSAFLVFLTPRLIREI